MANLAGIAALLWFRSTNSVPPAVLNLVPPATRLNLSPPAADAPSGQGVDVPANTSPSNLAAMLRRDAANVGVPSREAQHRLSVRMEVIRLYNYLFATMPNLPADTRRRVLDLLCQREAGQHDARAALLAQGVVPGSDAWNRFNAEAEARSDAAIAAAFGPAYPNALMLVNLAHDLDAVEIQLGGTAEFEGVPLSLGQKLRLAAIYHDARSNRTSPDEALKRVAPSILSAEQMRVLQEYEDLEAARRSVPPHDRSRP
ncbi:MAG TPA: hypothetical protein VHE61_20200 [Opitutaceae bacterium]|nr:hypothetical protein [Opitutaceae bacterium]